MKVQRTILKKLAHDHERRFLFRLALALGKTVNQLSQELSFLNLMSGWRITHWNRLAWKRRPSHRLMVSAVVNGPLQRKDKTLFTLMILCRTIALVMRKNTKRDRHGRYLSAIAKGSKRWQHRFSRC
ncbi:hypothetical protein [Piscirickettsia salmonis]|uniref:hypothetical protein n=1 Tax=Piscirickettsia salmonis TaxID=1238 RepID=UPI00094B06AC|nr:hypothetical protein [Piscirickettsia salmonis]